jgi:hypothetical protein
MQADLGQHFGEDLIRNTFAVDEHAVAVENHEIERLHRPAVSAPPYLAPAWRAMLLRMNRVAVSMLLGATLLAAAPGTAVISIDGALVRPQTLDASAIAALPHVSLTVWIREVTGFSVVTLPSTRIAK